MAFFLAGIPAALLVSGPLDRLLGAVEDECRCFLAAHPDGAFDAQNPRRQVLDPPHRATDDRLISSVETGHKILREGAAIRATIKPANDPQARPHATDGPTASWPQRSASANAGADVRSSFGILPA